MKFQKRTCFMIFACLALITCGQCSFQYISNDTVFQDYIEFVYPRKSVEEIVTIGSRLNRGIINDSIFNASVFQAFDYCGNILNKTVYRYVGDFRLSHKSIPTHNSFKDEPIGNTAIRIKDDEFLLVDKATDTISKELVMILYRINEKGNLKSFKKLNLDNNQANLTAVKNVLELKNGMILVILWDYAYGYFFYYFNENSDFLYKKTFSLGRGIRSIKEVDNGDFICTSLAYDNSSFQFYRLDTNGEIKWIVTPYNIFGSASEVLIENHKIYITGSVNFGVFLICDMEGTILNEFKYDTFYCQPRFCSAYMDTDNSFFIGGYIQHCQTEDSSGSDVAILKIDTNGTILWNKLYDFRNILGTSSSQGYFTDYGGFAIAKANDGGIITNGMSRYNKSIPGGVQHEDALLMKTEPLTITNTNKQIIIKNLQFNLLGNLIINNLNLDGPVDLIKSWVVYSINGKALLCGKEWVSPLKIMTVESGMYTLNIMDQNNYKYCFKFVKN